MNKTTVIYHSADFDGLFCRGIARKFLPDAELVGWDFKDAPIPMPGGRIYVLDLPIDRVFGYDFSRPEIQIVLPVIDFSNFIWIDHHKSSIECHPKDIPGYRIDGVAACRLAWQWFWSGAHLRDDNSERQLPNATKQGFINRSVTEPLAVRLAGEYDIWDKRDERTDVFQFGLRSRELSQHDWNDMLSTKKATVDEIESLIAAGHRDHLLEPDGTHIPATVWQLLSAGKLLQGYQQRNDAGVMRGSFLVNWEGLNLLAINTTRFNSLTFASKDVPETGHDALMGFNWDGKQWNVSLYHANHRKDLDLSLIAVKHGGGGHRGACGFRADKLPFIP